jgi:hypothetical protein
MSDPEGMKEVELQAFVTPKGARLVFAKLDSLGFAQKSDACRITYYLDTPTDTCVQMATDGGKVWQKMGKMYEESRTEFNVPMSRTSAEVMVDIFKNMGCAFKVAWLRHRRKFEKGEFSVTVDAWR